jgi:hypothetical protein
MLLTLGMDELMLYSQAKYNKTVFQLLFASPVLLPLVLAPFRVGTVNFRRWSMTAVTAVTQHLAHKAPSTKKKHLTF